MIADLANYATPALSDNDTSFATTAFVKGLFANSLTENGYQKLPGGLIIQWNLITTATNGTFTWTFPIPFPNVKLAECVGLMPGNHVVLASGGNLTYRSGTLIVANTGVAVTSALSFYLVAIGY